MKVAGLTIAERGIKQLAQAPDTRIIVATDGTIPLPERLPDNVEVQTVANAEAAASVAAGMGANLVGADVVRVARGDAGTRVTDEAGRRAAEDAVFAALFRTWASSRAASTSRSRSASRGGSWSRPRLRPIKSRWSRQRSGWSDAC